MRPAVTHLLAKYRLHLGESVKPECLRKAHESRRGDIGLGRKLGKRRKSDGFRMPQDEGSDFTKPSRKRGMLCLDPLHEFVEGLRSCPDFYGVHGSIHSVPIV